MSSAVEFLRALWGAGLFILYGGEGKDEKWCVEVQVEDRCIGVLGIWKRSWCFV